MNDIAGSDYGTVHSQQQGYGEGFILPRDDRAAGVYVQGLKDQAVMREKARQLLEKKKTTQNAFWKDFLKEDKTSPWHKYDKHIRDEVDGITTLGLDIMETDGDLATNKEFITRRDKLKGRIAAIKDLKTKYDKSMQFITANQNEIDTGAASDWLAYWEQDPSKIFDEGEDPPMVKLRRPAYKSVEAAEKLVEAMNKAGSKFTDESMIDTATVALSTDPVAEMAAQQAVEKVRGSEFGGAIEKFAEDNNISPEIAYQALMIEKFRTSMNMEGIVERYAPLLQEAIPLNSNQTGRTDDPEKTLRKQAESAVDSNVAMVKQYGSEEKAIKAVMDELRPFNFKQLKAYKPVGDGDGDGEEGAYDILEHSRWKNEFYRDILAGNINTSAVGYAIGSSLGFGTTEGTKVQVLSIQPLMKSNSARGMAGEGEGKIDSEVDGFRVYAKGDFRENARDFAGGDWDNARNIDEKTSVTTFQKSGMTFIVRRKKKDIREADVGVSTSDKSQPYDYYIEEAYKDVSLDDFLRDDQISGKMYSTAKKHYEQDYSKTLNQPAAGATTTTTSGAVNWADK
jgi:hypothetical protein